MKLLTSLVAITYYKRMDNIDFETAIRRIGSYRLAQMLGVKHPTIHSWLRAGRPPAKRVLAIEAATGISRYQLRPDVFGPAPNADEHVA